jgi:parallel beta-helix repeat protein
VQTIYTNQITPSSLPQGDKELSSSYIPHDPIYIETPADFSASGFMGSGAQANPYVLEGVNITTGDDCIHIVNVDVYYVIRNCVLMSRNEMGGSGICLDHAPHGTIESCTIDSKHFGVETHDSDECEIFNNTIRKSSETGIVLALSSNCTMIDNIVCDSTQEGVKLQGSPNCEMKNNSFYNQGVAIDIMFSSNCRLTDNDIHQNRVGIALEGSSGCVISNNSIYDNVNGITVAPLGEDHSNNATLLYNDIHDNREYGIFISDSEKTVVTRNYIFCNGEYGVELRNSFDCKVTTNKIDRNSLSGVKLQGGSNCTASDNTLDSNTIGVHLSEADDYIISNNSLQNNGFSVSTIFTAPSHFRHEFDNNSVNGRPLGYFWTKEDLVIDASSYGQIILGNCTNVTVLDGVFADATIGIILGFCTDCEVDNQSISDCAVAGLQVILSNNCSLSNNSIDGNSPYGIILYESIQSTLSDNVMKASGVLITGTSSVNWLHNLSNNMVVGRPLCYYWNKSNIVIGGSLYGQVIMAECNNMTVRDGVFSNSSNGVLMGFCTGCTVLNSSFYFNDGIYLSCSTGCSVYNNTVMNIKHSIRIENSSYCIIRDNIVTGIYGDNDNFNGIDLIYSTNCNMTGNLLTNGNYRGVHVSHSINCTVSKNVIESQAREGLFFFQSQECIVTNNTIQGCLNNGFSGHDSIDSTISFNVIHDNLFGIVLENSSGFTLFDNDVYNNQEGIWLTDAGDAILSNNTIHDNSWSGVHVRHSHNATITENIAYNNTWAGIAVHESVSCTLVGNIMYECYHGALALNSPFSSFVNNTVYNNVRGLVCDSSSHNCSLTGNMATWNDDEGIRLDGSDDCSLIGNTICENLLDGIVFANSHDCLFTFNYVQYNLGIGIQTDPNSGGDTIYGNIVGWNLAHNAFDDGSDNMWDDGISVGNMWGDHKGQGVYGIPGLAGAVDRYPSKADTISPSIDSPDDVQYELGSSGNKIRWSLHDDHPESYWVFQNNEMIESGSWSGLEIVVDIDGLSVNEYNYTLVVSDTCGNSVYDTVFVTVADTIAPTVNHPDDIKYDEGLTGYKIIWSPFDLSPKSYEILRNGTLVQSGDWNGEPIIINVDSLAPGVYVFTLTVKDFADNSASDSVLVYVAAIAPTPTGEDLGVLFARSAAVGGIGAIALLAAVFLIRRRTTSGKLVPIAAKVKPAKKGIEVLRGCEIIGGEFHYKVKVKNNTDYVVNKVTVSIISYPEDCLILKGEDAKRIPMIEPGGFRSPEFVFTPTKDCVEGHIQATSSYIDHENKLRTLETEPYVIRSVCDLLKPLESTLEEFDLILSNMTATSEQRTLDWNSEVLFRKVKALLPAKNFEIISMDQRTTDNVFTGTINGLAIGKYTNKKVAVRITISGIVDENKANVQIEGLGDDEAMLPTTIHEIAEGIQSWVCLNCGAALNPDEVNQLQSRVLVRCRYCYHTMSIDLYRKRNT